MAAFRRVRNSFLVCCLGMVGTACGGAPATTDAAVTGTATYRERMALPAGSVFEADLADVSRADAAAEVLGSVRIDAPTAPPIRFRIGYDPHKIDSSHRYAVRARILLQDRLLFTTTTVYPVLTQGAPATVEMLMRRAAPSAAGPAGSPVGGSRLRGTYTHMADAGWFTECGSGRRLPVAQEGDNAALEAAYGRAEHAPNAPLLVSVDGRIEPREPMEGPARPTLIVERFVAVESGNCAAAASAALENTYWRVTAIAGAPVRVGERQREPHLILHPQGRRLSGHGGCNSLVGSYTLDADKLAFSRIAGTMMACLAGMDQEQALHRALRAVTRWRIDGDRLDLLDAQGAVVLQAQAQALR